MELRKTILAGYEVFAMRLNTIIRAVRNSAGSQAVAELNAGYSEPISCNRELVIKEKESIKRIILRKVAPWFLKLTQPRIRNSYHDFFKQYKGVFAKGYRFAEDTSLAYLFKHCEKKTQDVLVIGCGRGGEDVQFWLRYGVNRLDGIDMMAFKDWDAITHRLSKVFATDVVFKQTCAEKLPFKDGQFDIVSSKAVLEHVKLLPGAVSEMARVLKSGGLAWHGIGPLYFSFGGDHCIASYGFDHGYDHLLAEQERYAEMINNQSFFSKYSDDPMCNYWAKSNLFSFLRPEEYLDLFKKFFLVEHVIFIISKPALRFKKNGHHSGGRC